MKLTLKRVQKASNYTMGELYINNSFFCDTLEDTNRGLSFEQSLQEIQSRKVYGETAIPYGTYKFNIDVISPKFKDRTWAKFCQGKLPRLENVPGFEGILIHIGNVHEDTSGCILVGENKVKGKVLNSTAVFNSLFKILKEADNRGEEI